MTQNKQPLKIGIAGATGRMGQALLQATSAHEKCALSAVSARAPEDVRMLQADAALAGACATADAQQLVAACDAVIDFTAAAATLEVVRAAAAISGIVVVGTTGFSAQEQDELRRLSGSLRLVQSGNFSIGVNVLEALIETASARLDTHYDIEIFEMHHRHKKDAPSGTALMLGNAAARGRGVALDDVQMTLRDGLRKSGDIGFSVARGGDVVGVHEVMFAGPGEMITLSHRGFNRSIYASGALAAALWARDKPNGLYSMRDVVASV